MQLTAGSGTGKFIGFGTIGPEKSVTYYEHFLRNIPQAQISFTPLRKPEIYRFYYFLVK